MMDTQDVWVSIEDFPGYVINPQGVVMRDDFEKTFKRSLVQSGLPTVGLNKDGRQYRRSLSKLVAEAFIDPPEREDFNTVMHLDGDRNNCHADNLVWRPRWFAIRHHQNRREGWYNHWGIRFVLLDTNEMFDSLGMASMKYGILENDILMAIHNGTPTFPQGYYFDFAENI